MRILLYHFGYRGDVLVVGQNFTLELQQRYPDATIDLMLRPRMQGAQDFLGPMALYGQFLFGEKKDYHALKGSYDLSFKIDEKVYPEGHLRTIFTRAGFPFRQHKLTMVTTPEDDAVAVRILADLQRPIIATQDDLARKWPKVKVDELCQRLTGLGTLLVVGPEKLLPGYDRPLSFRESAALLRQVDLFVGIDSGIAHAAALVGTQTVLLQMVHPEGWIAPTEYANPFLSDEDARHISIYPAPEDFCGHYFCLRSTADGGLKSPGGNPLLVKCPWKKTWVGFKGPSCFSRISVDTFYTAARLALHRRATGSRIEHV